jgi:hypothetical protein
MEKKFEPTKLSNFVFIGSLGSQLGIQIWATFIAGLTTRKIVPRHLFGTLQNKLFSIYFSLNSALSFFSLSSFIAVHPVQTWNNNTLLMVN